MLSSKDHLLKKHCFSLRKNKVFWDPARRSWEENSIKYRYKKRCRNRTPRKLGFDRFLIDLGPILGLQNRTKTLKKRCWNDIKIGSVFEDLLERDFFSPRSAKTRQRRRSPQKMESARAQWGGFRRGKKGVQIREPLRQDLGPRKLKTVRRRPGYNNPTRRPEKGGGWFHFLLLRTRLHLWIVIRSIYSYSQLVRLRHTEFIGDLIYPLPVLNVKIVEKQCMSRAMPRMYMLILLDCWQKHQMQEPTNNSNPLPQHLYFKHNILCTSYFSKIKMI